MGRQWELEPCVRPENFGTPGWPQEPLLSLLCQLGEIASLHGELICGLGENMVPFVYLQCSPKRTCSKSALCEKGKLREKRALTELW